MPINILEIHHCAIRIRPGADNIEKERKFYSDVLGLQPDVARPDFPDLGGYWMNVGDNAQLHLMAFEGEHPRAVAPGQDPSLPHVAFAVENIAETEQELIRMNVPYWTLDVLGAAEHKQIFLSDHSGNLLELHQVDTCRCILRNRTSASAL
ncbi:VOC family protein [Kineobactrum salinum]|uniref:Glyoxalase n=1 Tax=Kineobactrum salinum TaxID=2708301 RepID=A0A6C0TZ03_9GAMM|nr:VOC family protein [Kineobactrum salinum]QIB65052.1 glyoxalase [Kineobactrum salinum]